MFNKMDSFIKEKNFSGIVRIEKNHDLLFEKAYGYRDYYNEIPNQINTKFALASGSKFFTALGVLKLVESGRILLEDNLFDYIKRPHSYKDVTIRQVLSHTSGLPDYYDEDLVDEFENFKVSIPWFELEKPSDYYPVMPRAEMKFEPGTNFHYNNGGYILLAILIETLTGDYYKYLDQEIFKPFDLRNTGYYKFNALPKNTAYGYLEENNEIISNIYHLPIRGGGDGGIYSTGHDLHKLWKNFFDYKILNETLTAEMIRPQASTDGAYGLGVWLDDTVKIIGSDVGVSFKSCYHQGMMITIISNTSEGTWQIFDKIKRQLNDQL